MGDAGILEVFLAEAKEIIDNLETDIVKLEELGNDTEVINRIFRYFHTLKGSAGIAGMTPIYEFAHKLENLLDDIRSGSQEITDVIVDLIFHSIDWIKEYIMTGNLTPSMIETRERLEKLIATIKGVDVAVTAKADKAEPALTRETKSADGFSYFHVKARFIERIFEFGIDPLMVMEDLLILGTVVNRNIDKSRLPRFSALDPEKCYLAWDLIIKTDKSRDKIDDVFLFVKDENEIEIEDVTAQYMAKKVDIEPQEKKLGEILVDQGILTEDQLDDAVGFQDANKERIGDIVVKKGLATPDQVNEALKEQDKIKRKIEVSTIRVDTKKLDNLLNILGEIVIGQSTLSRMAEELDDDNAFQLKNALFGLDRSTREFQEQIMSIRMVPIGPTFDQFQRFVRDASHGIGKKIKLVVEGGDVELDKTVIEKIGDPLKHMIRNSIDHGIETEEVRVKKGKNPTGTITLKAYHQEGNVYIDVVDDGGGVPLKAVKEKAISRGIITKDEDVSKEKLLSFLFHPGFSTAQKVGDLSGRGVGMDVVKTNIEDLRGSVQIMSTEGEGATIRVKLPLTMAIIDGMLVRIGKHTYIIPLLSVIESVQPRKEDIRTVEEKGEVIHARGEYVSLIRLYDLFGLKSQYENPWEALVVMVESGTSKVGLMVDELLGQQQIVIKSLDSSISGSRAVSGASILGDGTVTLIIDIHGLISHFNGNG